MSFSTRRQFAVGYCARSTWRTRSFSRSITENPNPVPCHQLCLLSCLSELWCHAALLCPSSVIFPESSWGSRIFDVPQRSREQGMCYITLLQTNVTLINTIPLFVHWMHIEIYNYMELMLIVQPLRCPKVPELWFQSADRGELLLSLNLVEGWGPGSPEQEENSVPALESSTQAGRG